MRNLIFVLLFFTVRFVTAGEMYELSDYLSNIGVDNPYEIIPTDHRGTPKNSNDPSAGNTNQGGDSSNKDVGAGGKNKSNSKQPENSLPNQNLNDVGTSQGQSTASPQNASTNWDQLLLPGIIGMGFSVGNRKNKSGKGSSKRGLWVKKFYRNFVFFRRVNRDTEEDCRTIKASPRLAGERCSTSDDVCFVDFSYDYATIDARDVILTLSV
jgi:hypothetical protein